MLRSDETKSVGALHRSTRGANLLSLITPPGLPSRERHSPRPPRAVLRVGVSGHRPSGLSHADLAALRARVGDVLQRIRTVAIEVAAHPTSGYAAEPTELRLVSALAEGGDRIAAEAALAAGYALQAPLPFPRAVYEEDFASAASRESFRGLLARATAVLELDGRREDAPDAYAAVGRVVLAQSDLLLAIWDGEPAAGAGGTGRVVDEARRIGVPVVWIDARSPHETMFLVHGALRAGGRVSVGELATYVRQLVAPQPTPRDPIGDTYYRAHLPARRRLDLFQRFRRAFEIQPADSHAAAPDPVPEFPAPAANDYTWAGLLAEYYGGVYRDSFVGNYLLGALAVVAALAGFVAPLGTAVELILISAIVFITYRGKRHDWHRLWVDHRLLAEQFRVHELLLPIGRVPPSFRAPPHAADVDLGHRWIDWLVRARTREIGMTTALLDEQYLDSYRRFLRARIADQAAYHHRTAERHERLHHRLHRFATALFWVTLAICAVHLVADVLHLENTGSLIDFWRVEPIASASTISGNALLTALAAALPAFGAALAGISSQAEFDRVARRSTAMASALRGLIQRLDRAAMDAPPTSSACAQVAEAAAEMMTAELLDWQVTFRAKSLELPA